MALGIACTGEGNRGKGSSRVQAKAGVDILPLLAQLRSSESTFPGFVSAENLLREEDDTIVVKMSTWQRAENWRAWETSKLRQALMRQAEGLLLDEPVVTMYTVMPTVGWSTH